MPDDSHDLLDHDTSVEEQIERSIDSIKIGDKIRRLRLKRSMGLVELGRLTGLSASFLSQLETGRCVPTLRNLSRIALVFGNDFSYFFDTPHAKVFRISRSKSRPRLQVRDKQTGPMISESMGALVPDRAIVPCIAEFELNSANASFFPEIFEGEEFVYVLAGCISFVAATNKVSLELHDVLWVNTGTAREYRCESGQTAKAMIVTCPQRKTERPVRGSYTRC